jgi:GNAT superfamily N-acetyltransferase
VSTVEIRPATSADARRVAEVHIASWRAAYAGLIPDELLADLSVDAREQGWATAISRGDTVSVSVVDDNVTGFAATGPARDDDLPGAAGELYAIYLEPEYWSSGIGHVLHEAAMGALAASGFDRAVLWVLDRNERALRFYAQHGWVADGAVKDDARGSAVLHELRLVRRR